MPKGLRSNLIRKKKERAEREDHFREIVLDADPILRHVWAGGYEIGPGKLAPFIFNMRSGMTFSLL